LLVERCPDRGLRRKHFREMMTTIADDILTQFRIGPEATRVALFKAGP
jgi:hypothetical protein